MTTYTKAELEAIVAPLGDEPGKAIEQLQKDSKALAFLKEFLPDIIKRGAIEHLNSQPANLEAEFTWHSMSNQELREEHSESAGCERMRRALLGLQEYNEQAAPNRRLYPTLKVIQDVAATVDTVATAWYHNPISANRISTYSDELEVEGLNGETTITSSDARDIFNKNVFGHLGAKGRASNVFGWPKRYD
jgi:hypothetical protein